MARAISQQGDDIEALPGSHAANGTLQKRVLLIEDNEDAMFLVEHALQTRGEGKYHFAWASTLQAGLDHLANNPVDLILLDLGLPESSGPASYAAVRKVDSEVPVVVLTGDTTEDTQVSVVIDGVYDYLVKEQMSGGLLLEAVRSALTAHKRRKGKDKRDS